MNELELVINEVKKAVVGKDEHIKKIYADSELEEAATISPTCMLQPLTMTKMLPQREDSTLVPIDFNG